MGKHFFCVWGGGVATHDGRAKSEADRVGLPVRLHGVALYRAVEICGVFGLSDRVLLVRGSQVFVLQG